MFFIFFPQQIEIIAVFSFYNAIPPYHQAPVAFTGPTHPFLRHCSMVHSTYLRDKFKNAVLLKFFVDSV